MHLKEDKYILKMIRKFYSNVVVDSEKNIITLKVLGTTMNTTPETFTNTFKVWNKGVTDMNEYYVDAKTMMKAQHIKGNPSIRTQLLLKYIHIFNFVQGCSFLDQSHTTNCKSGKWVSSTVWKKVLKLTLLS